MVETIGGGRLVPGLSGHNLLDARTGKWVGEQLGVFGVQIDLIPSRAGVWMLECRDKNVARWFIPNVPVTSDPEIVKLWSEVISRHELDPRGGPDVELNVEAWEERRQKLARMTPSDASPILRAVAEARSFYYKKNELLRHQKIGSIFERYLGTIAEPDAAPERYREASKISPGESARPYRRRVHGYRSEPSWHGPVPLRSVS